MFIKKLNNMTHNFKKIFIVDDDPFHLEISKQILSEEGLDQTSCFESGVTCLNEIHQNPDIVFLDHQMEEYSGFETLTKIKRHNPNIFVVMVSGQKDIQTAVDSLKHGAFDYIKKDDNLEDNIKSVLHKIEQVREMLKLRKPSLLKSIFKFL